MTDETLPVPRDPWRDELMLRIGMMQGDIAAGNRLTEQVSANQRESSQRQAEHAERVEGRLSVINSNVTALDRRVGKVEVSAKSFDDLSHRAAGGMMVFSMLLSAIAWVGPIHAWVNDRIMKIWHSLGFA
jgi:hypothetical protein